MTILSAEQAAHFEKLLNEYEQMREDAQAGLKETVGDLREKLGTLVAKDDLAAELSGFREAVKRRRDRDKKPEKVAKAEAKSDVADAYELLLENAPHKNTTRTQRPTREQGSDTTDLPGLAERLHRLAAQGDTDALQVIAAAKYGPDVMRAVAAGILERDGSATDFDPETGVITESSGSTDERVGEDQGVGGETLVLEPVGSTPNGAGRIDNPAKGTALRSSAISNDRPLAGSLSSNQDHQHNVEMPGDHPGPLDTHSPLPHPGPSRGALELAADDSADSPSIGDRGDGYAAGNVKARSDLPAVGGSPTPATRPIVPAMPPIPEFLRRANTSQTGRA